MTLSDPSTISTPTIPPAFAAKNLCFGFGGNPVLQNLSVEIPRGKITAIIGPNGAGKSTLAHLLIGYLQPDGGSIDLMGKPRALYSYAQAAALVAFVPQLSHVGFAYSVRDIVLMGRWPVRNKGEGAAATGAFWLGEHSPADLAAADQALWDTDVHHLAHRAFNELSGGERQRVTIARALAHDAPIMILDEPTTGVDLWHQLEILSRLRTLAHEHGRAIVLVSHDLNMALNHCDNAILLAQGKLVAAGAVETVLTPEILSPVYRVTITPLGPLLHFSQNTKS